MHMIEFKKYYYKNCKMDFILFNKSKNAYYLYRYAYSI